MMAIFRSDKDHRQAVPATKATGAVFARASVVRVVSNERNDMLDLLIGTETALLDNVEIMTVKDWIAVPDNPRQRNTVRRAALSSKKHLKQLHKIHTFVSAASIDGEIYCKLDGHTRAHLWDEGTLGRPEYVVVNKVEVESEDEAKAIYDQLDSRSAVKQMVDTVESAANESGISLTSPLLCRMRFSTQVKIASSYASKSNADMYTLMNTWKPELVEVDRWGLSSQYSTLLASMILICVDQSQVRSARDFFTDVDGGKTNAVDGHADGVTLLIDRIKDRRGSNRMTGYDNLREMVYEGIACYSIWKSGKKKRFLRVGSAPDELWKNALVSKGLRTED